MIPNSPERQAALPQAGVATVPDAPGTVPGAVPAAALLDQAVPVLATVPVALRGKRERWVRWLAFIGVLIAVGEGAFLLAIWLTDRSAAIPLLLSIPVLFAAGKDAAIPFGIATGGSPLNVFLTTVATDVAGTLILFPLIHVAMDRLHTTRGWTGRILRGATKQAERRRKWVDRYGVAGLFMFGLIPFAFNGPPVLAVLGRLGGLTPRQVVPVLMAVIVVTAAAWTVLYTFSIGLLESFDRRIPAAIAIVVMVIVVTSTVVSALREKPD